MKAVFISNYINHHQIPFSNALYEQLGDDYHFIQTEPMEEERIAMGWGLDAATLPYVVWADREEERCRKLIEEADLVFAGWTKRLDLVLPRLSSGKLTFRVSERIYREGPVSYTHLDVYKRQGSKSTALCRGLRICTAGSVTTALPLHSAPSLARRG